MAELAETALSPRASDRSDRPSRKSRECVKNPSLTADQTSLLTNHGMGPTMLLGIGVEPFDLSNPVEFRKKRVIIDKGVEVRPEPCVKNLSSDSSTTDPSGSRHPGDATMTESPESKLRRIIELDERRVVESMRVRVRCSAGDSLEGTARAACAGSGFTVGSGHE